MSGSTPPSASSSPQSIISPSKIQLMPSTIVCVESDIRGDVTFGHRTVVHPCAKIYATNGPIIIGDGNLFEELSILENRSTSPLIVGNQNVFEVKSIVRARGIGDNNVFECKCTVGEMVTVGNGTSFGGNTFINPASPCQPQDFSVFFGNNPTRHRIAGDKPQLQTAQVDHLARSLTNYHHIRKPMSSGKS